MCRDYWETRSQEAPPASYLPDMPEAVAKAKEAARSSSAAAAPPKERERLQVPGSSNLRLDDELNSSLLLVIF